jgi:hypothetical protein
MARTRRRSNTRRKTTARRSNARRSNARRSNARRSNTRRSNARRSNARHSNTRRSVERRRRVRKTEVRRNNRKSVRRNSKRGPVRRMVRSQEISGFEAVPPASRRKTQKRKKAPSEYNKFMKRMSGVLRKENPGVKQPEIMKMVAKKWNEQKK